jgi:hypothetical protein
MATVQQRQAILRLTLMGFSMPSIPQRLSDRNFQKTQLDGTVDRALLIFLAAYPKACFLIVQFLAEKLGSCTKSAAVEC